MLMTQACKRNISIHLKTFGYRMDSSLSLSLSLFLSISLFLFNEIDVDAWEYERTPKYAPGHKMANDKRSKKNQKTVVGLTVVAFASDRMDITNQRYLYASNFVRKHYVFKLDLYTKNEYM